MHPRDTGPSGRRARQLAEGLSVEQIIAEYPALRADDVLATLAYAAELARERTSPLRESA